MGHACVPSDAGELSSKLFGLRQCNVVIVDEVHERDMLTDTGLGVTLCLSHYVEVC